MRETNHSKPADKAVYRAVSELLGRNESERIGGPESKKPRRPSPQDSGEGIMTSGRLADTWSHSGGVLAVARQLRGHVKQLEKPSSSHREIGGAASVV